MLLLLTHVHQIGENPEQLPESVTPPPLLFEGTVFFVIEQFGVPGVDLTQVNVKLGPPESVKVVQSGTSSEILAACDRDEYIAATIKRVMPKEKTNRGRAKIDGFDGFISTP
ncbi:MAG TPA: hypothetical protein VGL25_13005 [Casimicrobiaceae bacterium]